MDLYLPWAHALPTYSRLCPSYGQNLVQLVMKLALEDGPDDPQMAVLDIGANVGDSAAQILAAVDASVLCVEGDPYWLTYLHKNLGEDRRVTIEAVLLSPDDQMLSHLKPVRSFGTTKFSGESDGSQTTPTLTAADLRERNPNFERLRLVKSDTDGFDPVLVPAAAEAWTESRPVLFFEFDPSLAHAVGVADPNTVWDRLHKLGYTRLAVWDNVGSPLGQGAAIDASRWAASLVPPPVHLGYHYWDVAAWHADDKAAARAIDSLVPDAFDPRGIRSRRGR